MVCFNAFLCCQVGSFVGNILDSTSESRASIWSTERMKWEIILGLWHLFVFVTCPSSWSECLRISNISQICSFLIVNPSFFNSFNFSSLTLVESKESWLSLLFLPSSVQCCGGAYQIRNMGALLIRPQAWPWLSFIGSSSRTNGLAAAKPIICKEMKNQRIFQDMSDMSDLRKAFQESNTRHKLLNYSFKKKVIVSMRLSSYLAWKTNRLCLSFSFSRLTSISRTFSLATNIYWISIHSST